MLNYTKLDDTSLINTLKKIIYLTFIGRITQFDYYYLSTTIIDIPKIGLYENKTYLVTVDVHNYRGTYGI